MNARYPWALLLALVIAACGSVTRSPVERILEDGDCSTVPDIERRAITVSDRGSQVTFRWNGTRFGGMVQTAVGAVPRDASYGPNSAGEWERRFPDVSATTTIPGAFLGFPAAADPRAGVLAAAVYDERYTPPAANSRGAVIVDVKTSQTQLVGKPGKIQGMAWSPKGDYVTLLEVAPPHENARIAGDVGIRLSAAPQFDMHATVYAASGLAACSRLVASALPTPSAGVAWE
jgi:hypothetical protein